MAEFNKAVSTNVGLQLIASALANNKQIQFTKVSTSSNIYPSEQIPNLTSLANVKQTSEISNTEIRNDTQINLQAIVQNESITEGYEVNSIGIYAKETGTTNEILYAVASVSESGKGAYIPAYNNITVAGIELNINIAVTDKSVVSLEISPTAVVTESHLQEELAKKANKKKVYNITLDTTWTGTEAPYTKTIEVQGILATDEPDIKPVWSETLATRQTEKEEYNKISLVTTSAGSLTFTCDEDKPSVSLNLKAEVTY